MHHVSSLTGRFSLAAIVAISVSLHTNALPASEPATAASGSPVDGASGGIGFVAPAPQRSPRLVHPQPNLRHATPQYQATFAMSTNEAALLRLLDQPLLADGLPEFEERPLRDVAAEIEKAAQALVQIDHRALEDAGLDRDTPFSSPPLKGVVDAETWETVGGQGAIRPLTDANVIVIDQTLDSHMKILELIRATLDGDLVARPDLAKGQAAIRVYHLRHQQLANTIVSELAGLCNAALGEAADASAKVTLIGDNRIVVQSASRPFQVYAGELIASLDGVTR